MYSADIAMSAAVISRSGPHYCGVMSTTYLIGLQQQALRNDSLLPPVTRQGTVCLALLRKGAAALKGLAAKRWRKGTHKYKVGLLWILCSHNWEATAATASRR